MKPDAAPLLLSPVEAFARWAETYDHGPNPLLALEERLLPPLLPELAGCTALDAACGAGRWLHRLRQAGAAALGVDLSPAMLRQAAGKPALRGRLVRADCAALPVRTAAVDLALCSFAVGYLADLRRCAAELARVVRAGGHLLVADFHPSAARRGWKRSFRWAGRTIEIASFDHSLDAVFDALAAAGFDAQARLEAGFDEPERPAFARAGKAHLFDELRREPAIFIGRFRRNAAFRD